MSVNAGTTTPRWGALLALCLTLTGSACDPCWGTADCGEMPPHIVIDGQIVRAEDGRGVDGIRIDVVRTGGVRLGQDSISVTTADGGFWHIDTPASAAAEVGVNVRVHTPVLKHPYIVPDMHVLAVTRHGESRILDRWVVNPYFPYYGDLFLPGATEVPVTSASVDFQLTSGVLTGPAVDNGVVHTNTDPVVGRAQLFVLNAFATDTGAIVGDMTVQLPAPNPPGVVRGVKLSPTYLYRAQGTIIRFAVEPGQ